MDQPLVSIIIPVYKVEKYLRRCLDSVQNQTYRNIDVILVDDASPDNCPQICDEYAENDARFHVIHKENGGPGSARNAGLDYCEKGEYTYCCFIDADDFVHESYVESLVRLLQKHSCYIGNVEETNDASKLWNEGQNYQERIIKNYQFHRKYTKYTVWGSMFHKKLLTGNLRFQPSLQYNEDYLFKIGLIKNNASKRYVISKQILYFHEGNRPESLAKNKIEEKLYDSEVVLFQYFKEIASKDKNFLYLLANYYYTKMNYYRAHNDINAYKKMRKESQKIILPTLLSKCPPKIMFKFLLIYYGIEC